MAGSDPSSLLHSLMAGTSATTCMTAGMDEEMEEVQLFESEMIPIDEDAADGDEPAPDDLNLFLEGKITFKELARKMDEEDEIVPDEDDDDKEGKDTDDKELGGKKVNRKKRIRSGGRRSKLNEFNASLLGNAELYFARGKCEDAIAMVLQVVKENPLAHELYQTLGDFYDQLGEEDKALQYYHIAAYLCPHDGDSWRTVAEKHAEQGNFKESIACYDKAIRYIPAGKDNIACRMERSRLLEEEIKDLTKAIDGYESVLNLFTAEDEEFATDLAKKIARLHFDNRNGLAAVRTLETTFAKYEKSVEPETVNMYIELLISEKMIHKALLAFSKYCGVQIIDSETGAAVTESLDEDMITQMATRIAVNLIWPVPIDLLSKLVVCLIGLRAIHSVSQLQKQIEDESVETMGDLYLDVAEAYIEAGMHSAAEPFLHRLVQSSSYGNETAVWLRYARCLKEMGLDDRSIDAYFTVLSLQSDLCDARLELSHLLLTHNRSAEAVEVSSQIGSHILNLDLLLVRCNLLYEKKRFPEFVATAFSLLQCDMIYLKHERELTCMITSTTHRTRLESLRDVHKELKITPITNQRQDYTGREPSSEEYFSVFLRLCYVLAEKERDFDQLTRLVLSAYTSQSLSDRESSLDFIALMSLYKAQNSRFAYLLFKAIIGRVNMETDLLSLPMLQCMLIHNKHSIHSNSGCSNSHPNPLIYIHRIRQTTRSGTSFVQLFVVCIRI